MKIKTSELIDEKLNWAVVKASGQNAEYWLEKYASEDRRCMCESPSTNWSQGGPIIERECICTYASGACSVAPKNPDYWVAEILDTSEMITQYGPTPLIAAMRCFIASKLGDEIEIPEELT